MSVPALPAILTPALSGRDAVADALYRSVMALDTADDALFKSAFTTDAVLDVNGTIMEGYDAIYSQCYAMLTKLDTNHFLSNMRINIIEGDSKAQVTCSALSQHYRGGEGMNPGSDFLLAGGLYWVELVKDSGDGLWKMKHWTLKSTWGQGDWGILGK
ncbi:SnoaL-like domain [Schizosaccharomyces osmophilus]|uniref:SnoaL-like domain n=1 Tax=Schizosaccharomyces osmophilus TaxID=2545709 RepID=A0AAE9W8Y2_9SCHI|nr:SnoaL-like domain [Schizosaccharomyces osmophilus]WBW71001.1 SnoaL-like domain [Schizosaccharomyces osmophilus]